MWWMLPALVWGLVSAQSQPPRTLVEAAKRAAVLRQQAPPVVRAVTDRDVPRAAPPVAPPAAAAEAAAASGTTPPPAGAAEHGEAWWRERMTTAKTALDRDQMLMGGLQSRLNALATDITNRDDPAQRAQLVEERQRTQLEWEAMRKQVDADRDRIAAIEEEARVQGIPPGWIR
jgi:hypothetical protein